MAKRARKVVVFDPRERGKAGGLARAANMSDKARSNAARKAVMARWARAKQVTPVDRPKGRRGAASRPSSKNKAGGRAVS